VSILKETVLQIKNQINDELSSMSIFVRNAYPNIVKALEQIDDDYTRPKRRKGYNLVPIETKKYGLRLYARLSHNGKTLPTKFNTYTDNEAEADLYIKKNKEHLIEEYLSRKDGRMYKILENFYDGEKDNMSDKLRKNYESIIKNRFIPFLRQEKIADFGQINKKVLVRFQDYLLKTEIKMIGMTLRPQTVNNNIKAVKRMFKKLERQNIIEQNPCDFLKGLPVREENRKPRGCYELEKIYGIFAKKWKDELSYLLCSIIYTTGMRNSEIKRIKPSDLQVIEGHHFIKIETSKTANGIRLVPLHKSLYEKINAWGKKNNTGDNPLFCFYSDKFIKANKELARHLKASDEELKKENITFYSGRHYWKTLMSAEGLGEDIEEIFMGHKVSRNVAKLYNHKDKLGRGRMLEKAEKIFYILDKFIFKTNV